MRRRPSDVNEMAVGAGTDANSWSVKPAGSVAAPAAAASALAADATVTTPAPQRARITPAFLPAWCTVHAGYRCGARGARECQTAAGSCWDPGSRVAAGVLLFQSESRSRYRRCTTQRKYIPAG